MSNETIDSEQKKSGRQVKKESHKGDQEQDVWIYVIIYNLKIWKQL